MGTEKSAFRAKKFLAQKAYFFRMKWYLVSVHTFFSNSASGQILKDDLNGFSSSNICFMAKADEKLHKF
jgi:hypothetical protein